MKMRDFEWTVRRPTHDIAKGSVDMVARIYRPAKTAMQSGLAGTREWRLDYEPEQPRASEPLMGWTSSSDMLAQVRLTFDTKEEAIAYATRNAIPYQVFEPQDKIRKTVSYSDNFKFGRIGTWTH
jgi:hypothetical protein